MLGLTPLIATAPVQADALQTSNAPSRLHRFDIPAQPLTSALNRFIEVTGWEIGMPAVLVRDKQSSPLQGQMTAEQALRQLLQGTDLDYRHVQEGSVLLEPASAGQGAIDLGSISVDGQQASGDWVYQAPRSVNVIDREQINRKPPRHAADMLEETSGVYTAVNQRDPGLSVNIRGIQDYGRVNMNIDGMRQNFSVNGHQQRNGVMFIDPEFIRNIEIEKGTQAGMGGAGVLGGIASFNTLQASDFLEDGKEFGGHLRAGHGIGELGNGTYFNGSAVFAFGNEIGDLLFGVSERHFGDYRAGTRDRDNLGTNIRLRAFFPQAWDNWLESEVGEMGSVTRSRLLKVGLNLPEDQRLQLSYMEIDTDSKNAWTWHASDYQSFYYQRSQASDIKARNVALDYSYTPDDDLIDLKAKLYFVTTREDRWNAGSTASIGSGNWYPDYDDRYQTDTWGVQLDNTSRFQLSENGQLTANYGSEIYQDTFRPKTNRTAATYETVLPYIVGATPKGERTMASLFGNLQYEYDDWLTLDAGLRYDRYRLKGMTGLTVWMAPRTQYVSGTPYAPTALVYDVDQQEGRFSPTLGIAIKPGLDWLQLYTRWGEGWRPPAVTEAFMSGRPHGGGGAESVYPNPFLKPERSHNWEAGFNIFKESLLVNGDRFGAKVAYFDTRIDDFSYMDINVDVPGLTAANTSMGRSAYQNNLEETRFRGVEYSLDYDAGRFYGNLSYTHMIGSNEFCSNQFYMGGADQRVQVGTAIVPGRPRPVPVYNNVPNDVLNNFVQCGQIMGSASYMPADRGSLTLGMRFFDNTLDVGARLRYSEGNGANLDNQTYSQIDQALWPQYEVYDLYASYWMTSSLNLALSMENVTDQAYFVAMGDANNLSLARGRTLTGMLEYRF
ncbi:TonB-dependent hemoglobin/transferrin/lactoferrin family receptor [Pseudomonas sp. ABC1]|nr:TonB-dependent hemoglobin/transferrin/lactoferrin family receptor [Pseudomonas sp. ABC1]